MTKILVFLVFLIGIPSKLDAACPSGWQKFKDNCYKKFPAASWNDARSGCIREAALLVQIGMRGLAENQYIKNTFGGGNWLGMSRCHTSSTCLLDFSPALWTNWASGQPDKKPQYLPGLATRDFAVLIQADGTWVDQPKLEKHAYICEKPEDPCAVNFCNPDASTCVKGICQCKPGYSGEYCYISPCDSDPCQNEGTCDVVNGNYSCKCVNHYSGKNCEVPPPCTRTNLCVNGVCQDISAVDYKCKCELGWIGKNCNEQPCDRRPCNKARKCVNKGFTFECVCSKGWTGQNCEKVGNAGGDPHYSTFDGRRYDFMGKCEYVFARDCSEDRAFDVYQQNEPCGSGKVSCTRTIRVLTQSIEITMERSRVIYVNGKRVNLPWKMSGSNTTITRWSQGAYLAVPDLLFSIRWDGSYGISVRINQRYENRTCGLMGNADSNNNNEFRLPDGTFTNDIAKFANSWKTNPKCANGIVPPEPCNKLGMLEYKDIKEKCSKLRQPPFKQCNSRIRPETSYIRNCEYDMCAMKGNSIGVWCQTLTKYDRACSSLGVNIDWVGKPGFEACGNPCASLPCFNGATCKNVNQKEFTCTCPKGFSGPTCKNVDCRPGYISRGNLCYRRMGRRPWIVAKCQAGDTFVSSKNQDENQFIYEKFVKKFKKSFWMNARVCGGRKLCDQSFGAVFYHNSGDNFLEAECVEMPYGRNGQWVAKNCKAASYYICKYEKF